MVKSFIAEIASEIINTNTTLENVVCILPSKRAGTFLKNELLARTSKTQFSPEITSIENFIEELASVKLSSNLTVLFEFYEVYKQLQPIEEHENFYTFSKWAQIALQDFNEIDRYLIDSEKIFGYLSSIKELNHWTLDKEKTVLQKQYLKFWDQLGAYYETLHNRLKKNQIGYQGFVYREAIENLEHFIQNNLQKKFYFIGFNALNNAESLIFQEFLSTAETEVFWDIDQSFIDNKEHDAGLFIRRYLKTWKHFNTHPLKYPSSHFLEEKNISIIGVPKNIGQANYVGGILENLHNTQGHLKNTAVVMGNESLLTPILNALPASVTEANITSGLPLEETPIASFFYSVLNIIEKEDGAKWYFKDVLNLFSNAITRHLFKDENIEKTTSFIHQQNLVYISSDQLYDLISEEEHQALSNIFISKSTSSIDKVINKLTDLCLILKKSYTELEERNTIYLEYLYRFYALFNQLKVLNKDYNTINDIRSLKGIYNELLVKESIDFQGEPLQGLQIMGVLESRNLDFETVIISSVNEGILPSGKSNNSFLPFDIKVAFGLPTYKEKDAIYTYHFYRLLQRAKNVYLLYNTEPDVLEGGEKSRFLLQLALLGQEKHHINEVIASPLVEKKSLKLLEIKKNNLLIDDLKAVAAKGFSPSSLTNYVRNPIDFYNQTILGIKELEEVEETVAANTLGTIVHNTLETLYKPLEGSYLTLAHLESMEKEIDGTITAFFDKEYKGGDYSRGKNLISYHIAKRYVANFIAFEKTRLASGQQIKILANEIYFKTAITIDGLNFPIHLKGIVDRVEEVDGVINIIDYKTGKVTQRDLEIVEWSNLTDDYKYSKAFQVLCYAYMMSKKNRDTKEMQAGIISFKNLNEGVLKFTKKDKPGRGAVKQHLITSEFLTAFEIQLKALIIELFNEEESFLEKEV
ncbi:PD-(D/E)XK nuclease family protein [Zhouia amylolytica]|uniref:PD-(D/E)XK nuclease family protein n=1 Tax=Zhouia amylolytica TaxID=376730 RepID=UPI0020CD67B9|nr:PD-(D/E)XK nuclease family protein [Zhouia amylolytica]MCQ0110913.1 PD-(D/E)XK nuclease family protein [Zhouia amylolytica]